MIFSRLSLVLGLYTLSMVNFLAFDFLAENLIIYFIKITLELKQQKHVSAHYRGSNPAILKKVGFPT